MVDVSLFKEIYEYQEITVSTIKDIKSIVKKYNKYYNLPRNGRGDENDKETYAQAFFRGQSNSIWEITPSINRSEKKEFEILKEFDVNKHTVLFDLIAYIQHYNTGTRFIDFTTDLDVALYFACSENFDKDAALFLWCYSPHRATWRTGCIQTELIRMDKNEMSVQDFSEHIIKKYP